ncbi:hypothetical protein [Paenibacillus polymyxa]|uniref:hypothetical protein n=1 Tax=Paenibacillus polymyxa TaxID=1406 RepID=UPI0003F6A8C9|nr:hypothetical protein [Paenibacillus polymyxa]
MAKKQCYMCKKEINTKEDPHYKFGGKYICYTEDTEDCVIAYCYENRIDPLDKS